MEDSGSSQQRVRQSARKRGRTGCFRCRARKRKCDEGKPRCQFCNSKNLECQYASVGIFLAKNTYVLGRRERSTSSVSELQDVNPSPVRPPMEYLNPDSHEEIEDLAAQEDHLMCAVDGLITLGNWTSLSPNEAMASQHPGFTPTSALSTMLTPRSVVSQVQRPNISVERQLELLVYFRYYVAPSLDICDMSQSFGLCVPELMKQSESVSWAVLALSSALEQVELSNSSTNTDECVRLFQFALDSDSRNTLDPSASASSILACLCQAIVRLPSVWKGTQHQHASLLEDNEWTRISGSSGLDWHILLLCARIDLSVALVRSATVPIACLERECSQDVTTMIVRPDRYSQQAIMLCMEAANICFGAVGEVQSGVYTTTPFIERWENILQRLRLWFEWRPRELLPALDNASNSQNTDPFPIIVYTTGQGILGNQLYHTAMLLLLQCRPRTLRVPRISADLSPLWHAERISGIAVNNNRRECWDPCLVTSLYVAARRMTHVSQQHALLKVVENMPVLAGVDTAVLATSLKEQWGFVDFPDICNPPYAGHGIEPMTSAGT